MPKQDLLKPFWITATAISRGVQVVDSYNCDLSFIQRQMLPLFVPFEVLTKRPRVLDVDDAIWLIKGGKRVEEMARGCRAVICGNAFLANRFRSWNSQIFIVPTAVNTNTIVPVNGGICFNNAPVLGWTGSSENYRFIYRIEATLAKLFRSHPKAKLLVVSDSPPKFSLIGNSVEFVRWSVQAEIEALRRMQIGIMPLDSSSWSQGKCSFKMLCYMAAGIPVVADPIGMNLDVLSLANIGFGPRSDSEWLDNLDFLIRNPCEGAMMGAAGRAIAIRDFAIDVVGDKLAQIFLKLGKDL